MAISLSQVLRALSQVGEKCSILELGDDACIAVTDYGGRVFGPFIDGEDITGWLTPSIGTNQNFLEFYKTRNWNLGGERVWLSPELAYFVGDRQNFWDSFSVPATIDPGRYEVQGNKKKIFLTQDVIVTTKGSALSHRMGISRTIVPLDRSRLPCNPGLRVVGYEQVIETWSDNKNNPIVPWIIRQVSPGGEAMISLDRDSNCTRMFGLPRDPMLQLSNGSGHLEIDAKQMFKIGVLACNTYGVIGYLFLQGDDAIYLHYQFTHDRQGVYHDEPVDQPGFNGFSTFVFQDDGTLGGYGELEFVGLDLGVDTDGLRKGFLKAELWIATGPVDIIKQVAKDAINKRNGAD